MHECACAGQPNEEKYHFVKQIMLAVCVDQLCLLIRGLLNVKQTIECQKADCVWYGNKP